MIKLRPELRVWEVVGSVPLLLQLGGGRSSSAGSITEEVTVVSLSVLEPTTEKDDYEMAVARNDLHSGWCFFRTACAGNPSQFTFQRQ